MSQATLVETSSTVPAIRPTDRVLEAERRHQHDGDDEGRRDRVGVADAHRDAVDQREHEHQRHREEEEAHRLRRSTRCPVTTMPAPQNATHSDEARAC